MTLKRLDSNYTVGLNQIIAGEDVVVAVFLLLLLLLMMLLFQQEMSSHVSRKGVNPNTIYSQDPLLAIKTPHSVSSPTSIENHGNISMLIQYNRNIQNLFHLIKSSAFQKQT